MAHKTITKSLGDGDEITFEVFDRLPTGFVKMRITTPDGRLGFTGDPEFWKELIEALTANMPEEPFA